MNLWRTACDRGETLSLEQQAELDSLVEAELKAATARTAALVVTKSMSKQAFSPLKRTLAISQGIDSLADFAAY